MSDSGMRDSIDWKDSSPPKRRNHNEAHRHNRHPHDSRAGRERVQYGSIRRVRGGRVAVKQEGRTWPHYGRFLSIERPHRVEYTWVSEATQGVESVVAVTFEPQGDQTEVTLRHSGVSDDAMGHRH